MPRAAWPEILAVSTIEVFSMMVGVQLTLAPQSAAKLSGVTGVVGIAGALRAILSLRCSSLTATKIAAQMLAVHNDQAEGQRCDAIGEICNIAAGHFKEKIGLSAKCMLTVPTVIEGTDYRLVRPEPGEDSIEFPLQYEDEAIWISLQIRK